MEKLQPASWGSGGPRVHFRSRAGPVARGALGGGPRAGRPGSCRPRPTPCGPLRPSQVYCIENAHGQLVRDVDFNPNKQYYLASCGDDCKVKFWDTRSPAEPVRTLEEHSHWYCRTPRPPCLRVAFPFGEAQTGSVCAAGAHSITQFYFL